jgi:hypothetical protein
MQKYQQWETAGEAAWGVALQRETVIRPLAEQPRLSAESVAEAACLLGAEPKRSVRAPATVPSATSGLLSTPMEAWSQAESVPAR